MPAPAREVKIALFMYALHKDSSTLKNWPLLLCYSVLPVLRHSVTIFLACFLSLQVQGKRSVKTTGVIEQWDEVIEELWVNKFVLIQCSIVLISPIPLSAADLYAGLGNKELY